MENRRNFLLIGVVYIGLLVLFSVVQTHAQSSERKIVVFKPGVSVETRTDIIRSHGARVKTLSHANSEVILTGGEALRNLEKNPNVLRVEDDLIVQAFGAGEANASAKGKPVPTPPPALDWGINKINGASAWNIASSGPRIKVGVIDTGIDITHPDLAANIAGGFNAISGGSYTDDNGHGTHVAGIIGALDDGAGVIGVDPHADLYAIKVLDNNGSGYVSDIIEGLDWAVANNIQVVNMSLGASKGTQSFAEAIQRAHAAGIVIVAAAGNNGRGIVSYPAAYPEVIAVAATDSNDARASFSNYGPQIDVAAPGVSIYSTYFGGRYAIMSGTSMASPFTAGVAALVLSTPVTGYDMNGNGIAEPEEVQIKIQNTSKDLGVFGWDKYFGWGRINALSAVQ